MEGIKYNQGKVPKCKICLFPDTDDPKRTIIRVKGEGEITDEFVTCPQIMTPFGRGCGKLTELKEKSE